MARRKTARTAVRTAAKAIPARTDRTDETHRPHIPLTPVVAAVAEILLAWGIHTLWGTGTARGLIAAGLTLSTVTVVYYILAVGRDRSPVALRHSVATAAFVGLHLVLASQMGPWTRPLLDLWAWGAITVVATWMIRLRVATHIAGSASPLDNVLDTVGINGKIRIKKVTPDRANGSLQLADDDAGTIDDAQKALGALEKVLKIPPGGARMVPDPDDASKAEVTFVRRNILTQVIRYQGPYKLGGSCAEPYRIGVYGDLEPQYLPTHIPGMGLSHTFVSGMTGAGKTGGAHAIMAERFTRRDVIPIVVDTVKGMQTLGPWLPGLDWVEQTEERALALFTVLKERVVPYLTDYLGRRGYSEWETGCGMPRLDVHIEEGSGLVVGFSDFVRLAERCRSLGVHLLMSIQRPAYTAVDVAARAQFGTVLCFGVKEAADARFAMPDDVLDAGADPSKWGNQLPGCNYLPGPGIPKSRWAEPARIAKPSTEELLLLARYYRNNRPEMPPGLVAAFGDLYTTRAPTDRIMASAERVTVTTPAAATTQGGEVTVDDIMEAFNNLPDEDKPPRFVPPEGDPEPGMHVDIDDDSPPPTERTPFVGVQPTVRLPDDDAHKLFMERFEQIRASGETAVRGRDFVGVARAAGRTSANWPYKKLQRLVKEGVLIQDDDGFSFVAAA